MRKGLAASLLVATWVLAAAPVAGADPLALTITDGRANIGSQIQNADIVDASNPATLNATIDPGSGVISAGTLTVPPYSTTVDGMQVTFQLEQTAPVTGSSAAGGALALNAPFRGKITVVTTFGTAHCLVTTTPSTVPLSTDTPAGGGSPAAGRRFTSGLTGLGSVAGTWTDASATSNPPGILNDYVCGMVDPQVDGPGGIWLEQDPDASPITPPASPPGGGLSGSGGAAAAPAAAKKCGKKRKLRKGRCVKKKRRRAARR